MAKQPRSLSGKTAVVTGGARGIGRAITQALIAKGVRVAIGDVDREGAERTAAELGDQVVGLGLDVTDLAAFTAFIDGTQEAMRRMRPRGTGHIVNIASLAGKAGYPNLATYAATKHAVVGLSEAVRFELKGTGVEVSCVMPGIVNTELSSGMQEARGVKNLT